MLAGIARLVVVPIPMPSTRLAEKSASLSYHRVLDMVKYKVRVQSSQLKAAPGSVTTNTNAGLNEPKGKPAPPAQNSQSDK
jgi:hypothetical protein